MTQATMGRLLSSLILFPLIFVNTVRCEQGDYIGCYILKIDELLEVEHDVDDCVSACEGNYYKYSIITNGTTCYCSSTPGQFKLPLESCNIPCPNNNTLMCGSEHAGSFYDTDISAPGPPSSINILNITETTIKINWTQPKAFTRITGYIIKADVMNTYADFPLMSLEWRGPNDTLRWELLNLQPGSRYNISVAATFYEDVGPSMFIAADTLIGTPDPRPPDIEVKERKGDKMRVHIPKAKNVNGPISMYRIIVSIELYQQGYIIENLGNHSFAEEHGFPYYITAEIDPDDIENDFIIGDDSIYNGFHNAPLPLISDIEVFLGVVSEKNFVKKIRYAESTKKIFLNINEPEVMSPMVVALGAGIGIGLVLLLIGIGLLIITRKRIYLARIQRGSQSMPLSLSEPCLEIENSGFMEAEEQRVDYYGNLKRKLWNIPRNLIDIDISCVVGLGTYGKFTRGKVQQHGAQTPGLVQVIADRELEKPDKKLMLSELDLLIKSNEHENVISLIGICETNTTLFVVLQDCKQSLKELLLQSRQRDLQNNKFCLIPENKILQMCADITRGMEFLHSKKIYHKKLCCRNIVIGEDGIAKVSGFGLSHMRPLHETPDYMRWTSQEMLKQSRFNPKADVWSFGVLLWEAVTLGATPYGHSSNKEVSTRILRGMRPAQPSYMGDDLFQICLQCWQVDPDERLTFAQLFHELMPFVERHAMQSLSFTHYSGFEYEQYVHQYEIMS